MATRIVITGSAGMLGGNLAGRLRHQGYDVLGVDLRPNPDQRIDWQSRVADIRDLPVMRGLLADADVLVHCAAALPSYSDDQIWNVTVEGTRSVLSAAAEAAVSQVVHISSTAVYGLPATVPTTEDYPPTPVDAYGRAKVAAEKAAEEFRKGGRCVTVLRPKTFLGPGRMGLFAMLFEWAEEGRNFPVLGSGDVRIQMLAIDDLTAAISDVLSAPHDVANDTYNIAAAEFGTLREDFQSVLDAAGHGKRVVALPARPALLTLRLLESTRLSPVYGRLLQKLLADSYVSIEKARERFGFQPRYSNRDAILRTFEWWRASRGEAVSVRPGSTSRDAWRQGALPLAKAFF